MFNILLEIQATAREAVKKEDIVAFLFANGIILYVRNPSMQPENLEVVNSNVQETKLTHKT